MTAPTRPAGVTVAMVLDELARGFPPSLDVELLAGKSGVGRRVTIPYPQKTGLALSGFDAAVKGGRVLIFGESEIRYLESLDVAARDATLGRLYSHDIPAVLITQGFAPPERVINTVSGAGTMVGSLLGPVAVSLALPPVLLTAGPEAGPQEIRYRSTFLPVLAGLTIAVLASTAVDLADLVPPTLLLAMAGLALLGALIGALKEITRGPLILGPIFAFAVALSNMTLFGLGPFFWALVLGVGVSLLLERDGWDRLRTAEA